MTLTATPTKLRSGDWGAKVATDAVEAGDTIHIVTRGGKEWDAVVAKVVWSGDGIAIVATSKSGTSSSTRRPSYSRHAPCPTGGDCWSFTEVEHCWECGK